MKIWKINGTKYTSVKEFAEYAGATRQTIYTWIYKGMPVVESENGGSYWIIIDKAIEWINRYKRE